MNKPGYYWENAMALEKRALNIEDAKKAISSLWRNSEGPFENILRLATYWLPFISGAGLFVMILDKLASFMWGYSLEDLGKWIDQNLGLGPGSNVGEAEIRRAGDLFSGHISDILAAGSVKFENEELQKLALFGGISKLIRVLGGAGKLTKTITSTLLKIVLWFVAAFGITKLGDMYNPQLREVGKPVGEAISRQLSGGSFEGLTGPIDPRNILTEDETKETYI